MPLFGLGVLILWLGWFGFNPGSTLGALDGRFAEMAMVTNLAAAAGVLTAVADVYLKAKNVDIGMAGNGAIAALVAITAPSGYVELWAAPIIGGVAGVIVVLGVYAIDKYIDDPVGALSAHGLAGIWGTLACGLFTAPRLAEYNAVGDAGPGLHGLVRPAGRPGAGRGRGVRVRVPVLLRDLLGHQEDVRAPRDRRGGGSRPGHIRARDVRLSRSSSSRRRSLRAVRVSGASRRELRPGRHARRSRHEDGRGLHPARVVRADPHGAARASGSPRCRICEVKGSGRQKGITERYRGAELTNYLRPKVKIECVVGDGDVQTIVDTVLKHARTGAIGDGKVFVLPVEEAYRIRTGETGEETLQAHPGRRRPPPRGPGARAAAGATGRPAAPARHADAAT